MTRQTTGGDRNWYAIHTYSGYENAVARNLKQRVKSLSLNDRIFDVVVPTEKKIRIKGGKKVDIQEKIYPGYVLVDMIVDDESWYAVRNTERVTGFVGSGVHPVPLSQEEVDTIFSRMKDNTTMHEVDLVEGDPVKIIDGPFSDLEGKIASLDSEKGKLKVFVSMFGKDTLVELDFIQVKRI